MHTHPSGERSPSQDVAEERVPRRRAAAWMLVFAVIALGVLLFFMYQGRVSPLLD